MSAKIWIIRNYFISGDLQSKTVQLRSALMAVKDYKSKYASQSEEMEVSKSTAERLIQENQNFKQQLTECEV